jgi:small GTP-binding protein
MTPKIAIVGRPNVGKSTLFNRLTGTRAALVSDLPGLTRDRKEGEAELGGHPITIIDTAGLEVAAKGSIADRMRQQTEAAIGLADLVLFVIDARDGVTATDETFARTVRASGRPVVLKAAPRTKASTKPSSSGSASRSPFRPSTASASAISSATRWPPSASSRSRGRNPPTANPRSRRTPALPGGRCASLSSAAPTPANRRSSTPSWARIA